MVAGWCRCLTGDLSWSLVEGEGCWDKAKGGRMVVADSLQGEFLVHLILRFRAYGGWDGDGVVHEWRHGLRF